MNVIVVVDDRGGMLFNHRRQSQDRVLREAIVRLSEGKTLWMNRYSAGQFRDFDGKAEIRVAEDFLDRAAAGDVCFVETCPLHPYMDRIGGVVLFRWNRSYPGDFYFDLDLSDRGWTLTRTEELRGSSHEKITMEEYCRE